MAIISSGQITIIDLYDAPSLNAWISASQPTTQTYNNTTEVYNPNYTNSPQVLTFNLTKAGSATSLLDSDTTGKVSAIKWTKRVGTTTTEISSTTNTHNEYKSGTKHQKLTTKSNTDKDKATAIWVAEGTWTDPDTNLPVSFSASIDLNVIQLAKASVIANMYAPDGDFFRNNTPASLKINADLYKDGALSTGSRKYKWFASDSSLETSEDSDAGSGWRKITAKSRLNREGAVVNFGFDEETTSQGVLTVYPDAVTNSQTFLVVITDNAGGTAGTKVKQYLTLKDLDDPIMVVIDSSDGNILKNGAGSTRLTARLWRNGEEIDTGGTGYTYKWYRWENNKRVDNFGGTGIHFQTGKELDVGSKMVNVKTTFKVEVEAKK